MEIHQPTSNHSLLTLISLTSTNHSTHPVSLQCHRQTLRKHIATLFSESVRLSNLYTSQWRTESSRTIPTFPLARAVDRHRQPATMATSALLRFKRYVERVFLNDGTSGGREEKGRQHCWMPAQMQRSGNTTHPRHSCEHSITRTATSLVESAITSAMSAASPWCRQQISQRQPLSLSRQT